MRIAAVFGQSWQRQLKEVIMTLFRSLASVFVGLFFLFPVTAHGRTINLWGYDWLVKNAKTPVGPGPNYFSGGKGMVYVDDKGQLNLNVKYLNGAWRCSEVILGKSLGYGTYIVETNSRLDNFDPNVVLGLFTYDTEAPEVSYREIDMLEVAKWGDINNPTNAQNVVQPCSYCPDGGVNCDRFKITQKKGETILTHWMIWKKDRVEFRTYCGSYVSNPDPSTLLHTWVKTGSAVPTPGNERVRFNLWLLNGEPPTNLKPRKVAISRFLFFPKATVPKIKIRGASPLGDPDGKAWGKATGVDPSSYVIEVYIKVNGKWWTKPYFSDPFTKLEADRSWVCDTTTGGQDAWATEVAAFLVPKGVSADLASGTAEIPPAVFGKAVAQDTWLKQ